MQLRDLNALVSRRILGPEIKEHIYENSSTEGRQDVTMKNKEFQSPRYISSINSYK